MILPFLKMNIDKENCFLMKNQYVIGIDIGTTATKIIVVDGEGNIVGDVQKTSTLISKRATWAEEDPKQWWGNVCEGIPELLRNTGIDASSVIAVGVGGMVPTLILLDSEGNVIRDSIQQNDARSAVEINIFKE